MFRVAAAGGARRQAARHSRRTLRTSIFRRSGGSGGDGVEAWGDDRGLALSSRNINASSWEDLNQMNVKAPSKDPQQHIDMHPTTFGACQRTSITIPTFDFGRRKGMTQSNKIDQNTGKNYLRGLQQIQIPALRGALSSQLNRKWQDIHHPHFIAVRWNSSGSDGGKKGTGKVSEDGSASGGIQSGTDDPKRTLPAVKLPSAPMEKDEFPPSSAESSTKDFREVSPKEEGSVLNESENSATTEPKDSDDSITIRVGPRIKKLSNEWNASDHISLGMIIIVATAVATPIVIRQMRRSDSTYEDIDPEDPVVDLAKMMRDEYFGTPNAQSGLTLDAILADLLRSKELQSALSDLVSEVIQSPGFKQSCQVLLHELWTDLINDPETTNQVIHLLQHAIQDKRILDAANKLVVDVVNDKEVMDELIVLLQRLGNEEKVQLATQALLVESAHNALNDPEILDHSMEFATDVVGDDVVQRTAGEALYNTLSYAVRPLLSLALASIGVGLIVVSIVALKNASAPEEEMDRMMDAVVEVVQSGAISKFISKILSMPSSFIGACKNAIGAVVSFPFRMIYSVIMAVLQAGNASASALGYLVQWIASLPGHAFNSTLSLISEATQSLIGHFVGSFRIAGTAISSSFIGEYFRGAASRLSASNAALRSSIKAADNFILKIYFTLSDALGYTISESVALFDALVSGAVTFKKAVGNSSSTTERQLARGRSQVKRGAAEFDRSARQFYEQLRVAFAKFLASIHGSADI